MRALISSKPTNYPTYHLVATLVLSNSHMAIKWLSCVSSNRARQLYKNFSMLFLFPVKDGKLSTGVNATFDATCYG